MHRQIPLCRFSLTLIVALLAFLMIGERNSSFVSGKRALAEGDAINSERFSKTHSISDYGEPRISAAEPSAAMPPSKNIPRNAIKPTYTEAMAASDRQLAMVFGGVNAIAAANSFEPIALDGAYPRYRGDLIGDDGRILRGHLSYAMHLYGSVDGTGVTEVYVPLGFTSHSSVPTPTDAAVTFYYPRLGNFTKVTLAVFHVASFQLSHESARVRIGEIGGRGGSIASYRHSHLEFYHGDTGLPPVGAREALRIDPATVFGSTY